jgi:hypothetical protein
MNLGNANIETGIMAQVVLAASARSLLTGATV